MTKMMAAVVEEASVHYLMVATMRFMLAALILLDVGRFVLMGL